MGVVGKIRREVAARAFTVRRGGRPLSQVSQRQLSKLAPSQPCRLGVSVGVGRCLGIHRLGLIAVRLCRRLLGSVGALVGGVGAGLLGVGDLDGGPAVGQLALTVAASYLAPGEQVGFQLAQRLGHRGPPQIGLTGQLGGCGARGSGQYLQTRWRVRAGPVVPVGLSMSFLPGGRGNPRSC
jgi:hypothetical protein